MHPGNNHALITKASRLRRLAETLGGQSEVAVDTESNSLFAYRERVCLVQFSTRQEDFLVDPLALQDLSALEPLFADPGIKKTFHAAEYDVICLKRDFGFSFTNIFDTMLAARILGRKEVGLGSLLESEFGIQVDKRNQRANWGQRPLPEHLLEYARRDTHYLLDLRQRLEAALVEKNLLALAEEDFRRVCLVEANHDNEAPSCWRVNGVHALSPRQAAVLQELCLYRDDSARTANRPLFKVMSDQTLQAIAQSLPSSVDDLKGLHGMTEHQVKRHGRGLLQAVERGMQAAPVHPPRNVRPDDAYLARVEVLKNWRKQKAVEMGVESDIILPRELVHRLASRNPRDEQGLEQSMEDVPWRRERFGGEILKALRKTGKKNTTMDRTKNVQVTSNGTKVFKDRNK